VRASGERLSKSIAGLTPAAERALVGCSWNGNVRELRNVIERACIVAEGEFITEREIMTALPMNAPAMTPLAPERVERLSTMEREHIQRALEQAGGNKKAAAQMLGVSRRALYRRLERLELGDTITRRKPGSAAASPA
jgi:two-component system response regulator HydG